MTVYSEPGHGTTLKVYLARVDEPLDPRLDATAAREAAPPPTETASAWQV